MRAVAACVFASLALLALAGCASAPRALLAPMPPASLGQSIEVRQQVTAYFGDQTRVMQVALKVAPSTLTLIGLSPIGQRLFTLSWNGRDVAMKSRVDGLGRIDPKRVLADLELAYWPLPTLRRALTPPLRLEQQGTARMLWRGNELLWFASRDTNNLWASALTIYNARVGYRLDVRPLATVPSERPSR